MVEKQNVTLSLPKALVKKTKLLAFKRDKSMSQFLTEALEEKVREDRGYDRAKNRQIKLLRTGFDLGTGGHITISREEIRARK